ncbi:hypothetical protein [Hymenobacter negativus]|uniref:Uncharacterized protein n=1 Tax=Hymenobacter negativus TaxID=2795026 RepID=A0ABS3QJE8_9BACT|nr:hypothetical protein [Hymenobacter negativus]MBO2011381.1 hypothetical protein [Hymenobacter negativus]
MQATQKESDWTPLSIPLDLAQKWVTSWIDADAQGAAIDPTEMRAFVVRRADFMELLAQQDTEFIRMYVGRKEDPEIDHLRPCLVLVSAAKQKNVQPDAPQPELIVDLIGPTIINQDGIVTDVDYKVFDFSHCCPPECYTESPLFIGAPDERCA